MTDQKRSNGDAAATGKKKLQLNKETIKDLSATEKGEQVRGGMPAKPTAIDCPWCTGGYTDN